MGVKITHVCDSGTWSLIRQRLLIIWSFVDSTWRGVATTLRGKQTSGLLKVRLTPVLWGREAPLEGCRHACTPPQGVP